MKLDLDLDVDVDLELKGVRGRARTQVPTSRNYTLELPTLGVIAGVNPVEVQ